MLLGNPVAAQVLVPPSLTETSLINPTSTNMQWILYPNPATNQIFINVSTDYTIYNQQGQRVKKGNCNKGVALDIAQLPIGNNLLQITNGDSYQFTKQ